VSVLSLALGRLLRLPRRRAWNIVIERGIAVPMRDGVELVADRWWARGSENAPVVLMRSPYGRGTLFALIARFFAERGFQVFIQSCRGTSDSGGILNPMRQEAADGIDTVNWVRSQPWFHGPLFTYGMSYLGFTQWALAKPSMDKIDAMALHVTLSNFANETRAFGGFTLEGSLSWTAMMTAQESSNSMWQRVFRRPTAATLAKIHDHLPLRDLDRLSVGKEISYWQDWVGHDDPNGAWWSAVDHSASLADINIPVTMIGGWRDIFLPWQVRDFEAMQTAGRQVWLTIGPWYHAQIGGMAEGVRQALTLFSNSSQGQGSLPERDRVRLYVMGAEVWRDYSRWPPPGSHEVSFYLSHRGTLESRPPESEQEFATYIYDPRQPTPAVHGPRLMGGPKDPHMDRLEKRADVLSFSTQPLSESLDAIGPVSVELFVRSTLDHVDFFVCVCDVNGSDRARHVLDGYVRLTLSDSVPDPTGVRQIRIDCWPTAYRFVRGHRLRLLIASGAHPRYARNLGTGEPLATATRMLVAQQQIFFDRVHPSQLRMTI
jgi:uncharacterized protein